MKNYRYFLFLMFSFFLFDYNVNAVECNSQDINRLKKLSENIIYQYNYLDNIDYGLGYQTYELYFENLDNNFFLTIYEGENRIVIDKDKQKFRLSSGKKQFKVYSKKCDSSINYLTIELPKYNEYSNTDFCLEHSDLDMCDEWYKEVITKKDFNNLVASYEKNDDFSNGFLNTISSYLWIVVVLFSIFVLFIIIFLIKKIKKNRLD